MKKEVYQDPAYESAVKEYLEAAQKLVQATYNAWLSMGFPVLNSSAELYEIIHNCEIPCQEQCNKLLEPPPGLPKAMADEAIEKVRLPDPAGFYKAAKKAALNPYCARELSLFKTDGKEIIFSGPASQVLIKSRSIFVESESQQAFYDKFSQIITLFNELNNATRGKLLVENSSKLGEAFAPPLRQIDGYFDIQLNPEGLKKILKTI